MCLSKDSDLGFLTVNLKLDNKEPKCTYCDQFVRTSLLVLFQSKSSFSHVNCVTPFFYTFKKIFLARCEYIIAFNT